MASRYPELAAHWSSAAWRFASSNGSFSPFAVSFTPPSPSALAAAKAVDTSVGYPVGVVNLADARRKQLQVVLHHQATKVVHVGGTDIPWDTVFGENGYLLPALFKRPSNWNPTRLYSYGFGKTVWADLASWLLTEQYTKDEGATYQWRLKQTDAQLFTGATWLGACEHREVFAEGLRSPSSQEVTLDDRNTYQGFARAYFEDQVGYKLPANAQFDFITIPAGVTYNGVSSWSHWLKVMREWTATSLTSLVPAGKTAFCTTFLPIAGTFGTTSSQTEAQRERLLVCHFDTPLVLRGVQVLFFANRISGETYSAESYLNLMYSKPSSPNAQPGMLAMFPCWMRGNGEVLRLAEELGLTTPCITWSTTRGTTQTVLNNDTNIITAESSATKDIGFKITIEDRAVAALPGDVAVIGTPGTLCGAAGSLSASGFTAVKGYVVGTPEFAINYTIKYSDPVLVSNGSSGQWTVLPVVENVMWSGAILGLIDGKSDVPQYTLAERSSLSQVLFKSAILRSQYTTPINPIEKTALYDAATDAGEDLKAKILIDAADGQPSVTFGQASQRASGQSSFVWHVVVTTDSPSGLDVYSYISLTGTVDEPVYMGKLITPVGGITDVVMTFDEARAYVSSGVPITALQSMSAVLTSDFVSFAEIYADKIVTEPLEADLNESAMVKDKIFNPAELTLSQQGGYATVAFARNRKPLTQALMGLLAFGKQASKHVVVG